MPHLANFSQQEFGVLIGVPLNAFRMWDSGLQPALAHLLQRSTMAVTQQRGTLNMPSAPEQEDSCGTA